MTKLIFCDVEATRYTPFSGVMTEFGAVEFSNEHKFYGKLWDASPDPDNPAVPLVWEDTVHYDEARVMKNFHDWLTSFDERTVFVSDNPAYDYQWINYYFDKHALTNPFGHSARRIGDFYAGLTGNWSNTNAWKRFRQTVHDHNPVNDALGNVEAVKEIVRQHELKSPK